MTKTLVFYKSKTGFTERYARWIAEELNADVLPLNEVSLEKLEAYKVLVFGGPLFASRISGLTKVQMWMEKLPQKTWVVFATGATPSEKSFVSTIEKINFQDGLAKPARFYYFLSGINFEKMTCFNRALVKLFGRLSQKKLKKQDGSVPTPPSKFRSVDLCNRVYIEPLVKYVGLKQ